MLSLDWLPTSLKNPQILAAILTIATTLLLRVLQPRPKVVWGTSHQYSHRIPRTPELGGEWLLHSQTVFVQNIGFAPAQDVEIILNFKPENLSLWPQLNYTTSINREQRFIVKIENLGRREFTALEMLHSTGNMPETLRVRTPRGECRQVPMAPVQTFSRRVRFAVIGLMFLGIFTVFEWLSYFVLRL
jgi:hypothetical protein